MSKEASEVTEVAEGATVRLELEDGYRFRVDLGEGFPPLLMDEPAPLGDGAGPNASAMLAAAVGNCLSASLLYCLRRSRIDVTSLRTEAQVVPARNAKGRLRIGSIRVELHPEIATGAEGRLGRCLELFEDFCVVTESVRAGIDVAVEVLPATHEGDEAAEAASDASSG
ncbi:MAG: OsmC family protein [Actinomycetota bacterium]|jgi:organic hydroperoxide reductase OsmC/OhrA|nr:OsmC family protein [Actinomycetota bacterium]MDA8076200.1 OsmC family protein [Actinomycetota bacterium]